MIIVQPSLSKQPGAERMNETYTQRVDTFRALLAQPTIPAAAVRAHVHRHGAPDDSSGQRALLWKLLLGYLPWERRQWAATLRRQRAEYQQFVAELVANPYEALDDEASTADPLTCGVRGNDDTSTNKPSPKPTMKKVAAEDDPLGGGPNNKWNEMFHDTEIRTEIDKDVQRTCRSSRVLSFSFYISSSPLFVNRGALTNDILSCDFAQLHADATFSFFQQKVNAASAGVDYAGELKRRREQAAKERAAAAAAIVKGVDSDNGGGLFRDALTVSTSSAAVGGGGGGGGGGGSGGGVDGVFGNVDGVVGGGARLSLASSDFAASAYTAIDVPKITVACT
jgi:hypothetical protein